MCCPVSGLKDSSRFGAVRTTSRDLAPRVGICKLLSMLTFIARFHLGALDRPLCGAERAASYLH